MPRQALSFLASSRSHLGDLSESGDFRSLRQYKTADNMECEGKENVDVGRSTHKPPQVCVRRGTNDSVTGGLQISFTRGVAMPPATPDIEKYLSTEQQTPAGVIPGVQGFAGFPGIHLQENRKRRRTTGSKSSLPQESASFESARFRVDFRNIENIGRGDFSEVFKATHKIDGIAYAIKRSGGPATGKAAKKSVEQEVRILAALSARNLRSANIVQYFSSWYEESRLHIQMELCGKPVSEQRKSQGKFSFELLKDFLVDIANALRFCHEHSYVHLDVKPDNIFIVDGTTFKLGDFGLAQQLVFVEDKWKISGDALTGDARYLSYEGLRNQAEDVTKIDMFALGASFIECASGRDLPTDGSAWHSLREGQIDEYFSGWIQMKWLKDIATTLIHPEPRQRISADALLRRDFILTAHIHNRAEQKASIRRVSSF
jgi:serine/threonine protein kinase